nr:TadE/TadG family type IV pilus assembly protein [uncultured Pseudodesulfovibrio sp.]
MNKSRNTQHRRGLASIEMALLLPIFMLLLIGIMDVGRLYWIQSVVRDAAFEGVRAAILHESTNSQIESIVTQELLSGGINQSSTVGISDRQASQPVTIEVSVPFEFFVIDSLIPSIDGPTNISAAAVMIHER